MSSHNAPDSIAMLNVFDEMAVQLQLMALNFAVESARLPGPAETAKNLFHEAMDLCDSIEFTALEISSLLKSSLGLEVDAIRKKTLSKLQDLSRHIERIGNLTHGREGFPKQTPEQPFVPGPRQKGSVGGAVLNEQALCQKSLSKKTVEIQNMLRQFSLDLDAEDPFVS
ncbi:MAG: hypothetical protein JXB25_00955 [Deltaproteobacteria bacterium]|nr:hypothetical protein [Deltaproteobacteria bacterium]